MFAIITPNWAAAAIAGEKERRTLPFLLATPLRDWQIVVAKLAAQIAQTGMIVLAGVPVLCALQFFGGVELVAILWGYAVLAVTVVSLASLAILCSVYARTVRAAGQRASQVVVGLPAHVVRTKQGLADLADDCIVSRHAEIAGNR